MRLIRWLVPSDAGALTEHYLGLDPIHRRFRFCAPASDAFIRGYCRQVDWQQTVIVGCMDGLRLAGALELHLLPAGPSPEFAISVAAPERGKGLGTELICRAALIAAQHQASQLGFACLEENHGMQNLARRLGGELEFGDGEVTGRIPLPLPDRRSFGVVSAPDGLRVRGSRGR